MNILMVTNTFAPNVSGVARSVTTFADAYRARGHRVLVVAPEFDGAPEEEVDVVRIGALRNFAGTDYSVVIGPTLYLARAVDAFGPDIVHSHGPFLLGTTAARLARNRRLPLVFTHHTLYEQYTHYVPGDSGLMKRIALSRGTRYANASDAVFAPSRSIVGLLRSRGVTVPIYEVPTGVPLADFAEGDGAGFRARYGIPPGAVVVGTVGRLAAEKNLDFLSRALARFLAATPEAYAVIVGDGPSHEPMAEVFADAGLAGRVVFTGALRPPVLIDAYHAMNVFAFASLTETQGLVLAEAMAAGVAVVAIDAPGAREIVCDGVNGRLAPRPDAIAFHAALDWVVRRSEATARRLSAVAREGARDFSLDAVADRALAAYGEIIATAAKRVRATARRPGLGWRPRLPAGGIGDARSSVRWRSDL
jgi:glycosyltransferase involved in cell wall biosynthesis